MNKWNALSVFILSIGVFEISGKQLFNIENSLERTVDLTTVQYNFWLTVNLTSIVLGFSMLHKLRELSVTTSLSLSQHKEGKEEK